MSKLHYFKVSLYEFVRITEATLVLQLSASAGLSRVQTVTEVLGRDRGQGLLEEILTANKRIMFSFKKVAAHTQKDPRNRQV